MKQLMLAIAIVGSLSAFCWEASYPEVKSSKVTIETAVDKKCTAIVDILNRSTDGTLEYKLNMDLFDSYRCSYSKYRNYR